MMKRTKINDSSKTKTFFLQIYRLKPPADQKTDKGKRKKIGVFAIAAVFSNMFTALVGPGELAPTLTSSSANP